MSLNIFYGGDDYDLSTRRLVPGRQPLSRGAVPARQDHRGERRRRGRRTGAGAQHPQAGRPAGLVRQPAGARDLALPDPRPAPRRRAVRLCDADARPGGRRRQRAPARRRRTARTRCARAGRASKVLELERTLRLPALRRVLRALPDLAEHDARLPHRRLQQPLTPRLDAGGGRQPARGPVRRGVAGEQGPRRRRVRATPTATPTPTRCRTPATRGRPAVPRRRTRTSSTASTGCSTRARRPPCPAGWSASAATRRSTCAFAKPFPTDHRGVVSTFDVTPGEAPMLVSPEHRRVVVGDEPLRVRFHGDGTPARGGRTRAQGCRVAAAVAQVRRTAAPTASSVSTSPGLRPGRYDVVLVDEPPARSDARAPVWVYAAGAATAAADRRARRTTSASASASASPARRASSSTGSGCSAASRSAGARAGTWSTATPTRASRDR